MTNLKMMTALLAAGAVSACSSGSSGPALPIENDANVVITQTDTALSLVADGVDVSLPLFPRFDRGSFVAGREEADDLVQVLAISETEDTFAAYLVTRDGVSSTGESFIGRTTEFDGLPTGAATLTGTYVGSFEEDDDSFRSYISGDAIIDVDFDDRTIGGRIDNRTASLFGIDGFEFNGSTEIIELAETDIRNDGSFAGTSESTVPENDSSISTLTTDFAGLISGTSVETTEIVGTVRVDYVTTGNADDLVGAETGVFAIGH